ncbi:MAG: hypothetical protein WDN27_04100 [Candidatus Saccharibacteria bacterium]
MTIHDAVEILLDRMNKPKHVIPGFFGAMDGTTSNFSVVQREMNKAIMAWRESGDTMGLKQMAAMQQAFGSLTDEDYEQIMDTLEAAT